MHCCCWFTVFNWAFADLGRCTLWQLTHDTLRASCWLPFHNACVPRLWQVAHVSVTAFADSLSNCFGLIFSGSLACASPGPWQLSQPWGAAGVCGSFA